MVPADSTITANPPVLPETGEGLDTAVLVYEPATEHLVGALQAKARKHRRRLLAITLERFLNETPPCGHVVAAVGDEALGHVVGRAAALQCSLGLIPVPGSALAARAFRLPREPDEALALAFDPDAATAIDLLTCNEQPVLWRATVGDVPFVDAAPQASFSLTCQLRHWWEQLRRHRTLRPLGVKLTTEKGTEIKTAATGLVVMDHDVGALAGHLVDETISSQDGQISAIVVAPASVTAYLGFLLTSLRSRWHPVKRLPDPAGYIKTGRLKIELQQETDCLVDGKTLHTRELLLEIRPRALVIQTPPAYRDANPASESSRETVRVERLPSHEIRLEVMRERLPAFSTALEEEFRDLFLMLRQNAKLSAAYVLLTMLSALLATFGLFQGSAPVVIGAMILAPLMAPIVSLSMGLLRDDRALMRVALSTLAVGVLTALAVSALAALLMPYEKMTGEIAARVQPTLLDLGVAVISGIAGAYAHAKESVAKSLPGVAIAVALVPPLCVAGIGIGWGLLTVVTGAMLLFATNLVGIAIAAAATFMVLGYLPAIRVHRGLRLSLLILAILLVPLGYSFHRISSDQDIEATVLAQPFIIDGTPVTLSDVTVLGLEGDAVRLSLRVRAGSSIGIDQIRALKSELAARLGREVILEASVTLVQ